jgi:hypothetical protein
MKTVLSLASSLAEPAASEDVEQQLMTLFQRWHDKSS